MSAEPSMEDILSSIKRIIAEEGDSAVTSRSRRAAKNASPSRDRNRDREVDSNDVLELSDPVREEDQVTELPHAQPTPTEPILSQQAEAASRGALDTLSRMVVPQAPVTPPAPVQGGETLESVVREMLRPMLRDWLDAKLPGMVEEMVAREIARITQGR